MLTIRRAQERGHANHGWLDTWHTFSFAGYHDPRWMGFGSLRVINDDRVQPGRGFGTHPHHDMEIITLVLSGALEHRDSMGNGRVIRAGDVQYMSAGRGVEHSEFNPSANEPVHLLQIWILPNERGAEPRYADQSFASMPAGRFHLVASATGRDGSMAIRQDADLWLARLTAGQEVIHLLADGRRAWLHVAEGAVSLNGQPLAAGDGVAVAGEPVLAVAGATPAQILLFDLA